MDMLATSPVLPIHKLFLSYPKANAITDCTFDGLAYPLATPQTSWYGACHPSMPVDYDDMGMSIYYVVPPVLAGKMRVINKRRIPLKWKRKTFSSVPSWNRTGKVIKP
jgi:hypothetical protein